MKKWMLTVILLLSLCLSVLAYAPSWQYVQDITVPDGDQPVKLMLSSPILNNARFDGADLRVVESGVEVPYKLYLESAAEQQQSVTSIEASSTRLEFRSISYEPANLFDGDSTLQENAYFQIDATIDTQTAWLVVDVGSPKLTSKAVFTARDPGKTFTYVQVEGSNDKTSWVRLKSKSKAGESTVKTVDYAPASFRYLRFTFWHTGNLVLNELELYGESTGYLLFFAHNGRTYELYYGNPIAPVPEYELDELYISATTPLAYALGERINPAFDDDPDKDGIGADDNCLFIKNPDQADIDNDGVGDVCDNCIQVKNKDQRDRDNDGFGDACDNCPDSYNPNQFDNDLNGIGYVCDDADNDGVVNPRDNCVEGYNPGQEDTNRNYIGDVCEDDDNDGIPNYADNCPQANADQADIDEDGIGDVCDGEESRMLENKTVVWGFIGLAIVVIGYLAFSMMRHPPE